MYFVFWTNPACLIIFIISFKSFLAQELLNNTNENQFEDNQPTAFVPPNFVDVSRVNGSTVMVRWDHHTEFSQDVQFYKVQYKLKKKNSQWKTESKDIPSQATAYQVTGLKPGNYSFKVVAVFYKNNDQKESEKFDYKLMNEKNLPADPPKPKATPPRITQRTEATSSDTIRLNYEYEPGKTSILGYFIYFRSAHAVSDFIIQHAADETYDILSLTPDTPYEIKVQAYSEIGVSNMSDSKLVKTLPITQTTSPPISTISWNDEKTTRLPPETKPADRMVLIPILSIIITIIIIIIIIILIISCAVGCLPKKEKMHVDKQVNLHASYFVNSFPDHNPTKDSSVDSDSVS